jgi:hypothetical protein
LEEGREEVDADKRDIAGRADRCVRLRRSDAHEQTDVKHRQTHGNRSPEERLAASKRVGCEDQEQTAHDHLDNAVNASGEETRLGAVKTEVLEDLGSVYFTLVADTSHSTALQISYSSC